MLATGFRALSFYAGRPFAARLLTHFVRSYMPVSIIPPSRGVQCYGVGIRCYARWGRMFFPLWSGAAGGMAGRCEKYLKLVIAPPCDVSDLCNASQGWSKQPHRTDY